MIRQHAEFQLTFARLVTHYWSQGCFLEEGQILVHMHRLADIPAVMIHGRYDVSGPLDTPHGTCTVPGRTASSSCSRRRTTEEAVSAASSSVPSTALMPL